MLRCLIQRQYHRSSLQWGKRTLPIFCLSSFATNYSTVNGKSRSETASQARPPYGVFDKIPFPRRYEVNNPDSWASLLEPALPLHLRQQKGDQTEPSLSASDAAQILTTAQRLERPENGIDLLFYLGIQKGRWSAVVWLIKSLVEAFGAPRAHSGCLFQTVCSWNHENDLNSLTNSPIDYAKLATLGPEAGQSPVRRQTLEELTDDYHPENLSRSEILRHDALGQIWRSLGRMTIACADGAMKPEVLEIIAYLHHMEIMPASIYNQRPSSDPTVIQQPPMLNLLSSRILTSLSDAAWRAHEKLVVEEFKAKGGDYASLRPEIPGMAYRVNVAGLRPEVWLELIIWSCLHGGWVAEGAAILRAIASEPAKRLWKPLSWRTLTADDHEHNQDWDHLIYLFNTRDSSVRDHSPADSKISVHRTISSEVVNAYVDALLSVMRVGVGERGVSTHEVLSNLTMLRKFLLRSRLSLGAGSWDAIMLRIFETQESVVHQRDNFDLIVKLPPTLGQGLTSDNVQDLPPYVLDGSASLLGLFHQALRGRIKAGDIKGSLRLFESVQALADENKHESVKDFLQKERFHAAKDEIFTSNYPGVDYPAFDLQIPATILGPFVELIADARAYDFGKWLLYSDDIDAPIIPVRLYGDPALTPALVRFAAETDDRELLSKLVRERGSYVGKGSSSLPRNVLLSFFESQVNLKRWEAAVRILQHIKDMQYPPWNIVALGHVTRMMLLSSRSSETEHGVYNQDLNHAKQLFSNMVKGGYERPGQRTKDERRHVTLLLIVLSAVDEHWARFGLSLQSLEGFYTFDLMIKPFNLILEGVVGSYGSVAGRRLLEVFWSRDVRPSQQGRQTRSADEGIEPTLSGPQQSFLEGPRRKRIVVPIRGQADKDVVVYGGLQPNLMTIRIILRKAAEEFKQADNVSLRSDSESVEDAAVSGADMVIWAVRCLQSLRMADGDIRGELEETLAEYLSDDIKTRIPELFQQTHLKYDAANDAQISFKPFETAG